MSAALVRKALEIVDSSFKAHSSSQKKSKKTKGVFGLVPESHKLLHKGQKKNGEIEKSNLLSSKKKLTVAEVRKTHKTKEEILKSNLEKLRLIREATTIDLKKEDKRNIIERGVTKRPIQLQQKTKKKDKTVFTEEDFKRFEEEYSFD